MAEIKANIQKLVKTTVESGKVLFGAKSAKFSLLNGVAKLIVISKNAPKKIESEILTICNKTNIPHLKVDLSSLELGSICGKPFPVSFITILDAGNSDILSVTQSV